MKKITKKIRQKIKRITIKIEQIFHDRGQTVRVRYRRGDQKEWRFGPKNLIPSNPAKWFATAFLWLNEDGSLHRIIAFPHSHIRKLGLQKMRIGRETFKTQFLRDIPKRYVFTSLKDLEKNFPWTP
jgi:hypothetical protein